MICERFGIVDVKGKNIPTYRAAIMASAPMIDANGVAVKFAKLPSYLKNEIKAYNEVFAVVNCSWIETIIAAAENESGKQMCDYNVTTAPTISEGEIIESASGDIVNAKGEKIDGANIFAIWDNEAKINNIANAVGNAAKVASKAEQKAK